MKNGSVDTTIMNEFIALIHNAYIYHQVPTIRPDDVWLVILTYLAKNVNENVEHYRSIFGLGEDKKEISIECDGNSEDLRDQEFVGKIFSELISKMHVANATIAKLECDFTTSTATTRLCSQVSLAHMMKEFFSMNIVAGCGFPAINFEGTAEDWQKIKTKLDDFNNIAHGSVRDYLQKCHAVIDKILQAYTNPKAVDWKKLYYSENCGSGSDITYDGFILDILNVHRGKMWIPDELTSLRTKYEFKLTFGISNPIDMFITAGPKKVDGSFALCYYHEIGEYQDFYQVDDEDTPYEKIDWNQIEKVSFKGKKILDIISEQFGTDHITVSHLPGELSVEYLEKLVPNAHLLRMIQQKKVETPEFSVGLKFFTLTKNEFAINEARFPLYTNKPVKVYDSIPGGADAVRKKITDIMFTVE